MAREIWSAVSLISGPHCSFMRPAGVESESEAPRAARAAALPPAGGDAAHADLRFLGIDRPALALDALEVALEQREAGNRVPGVRREAGALGVIAQPREAFLEQEKL